MSDVRRSTVLLALLAVVVAYAALGTLYAVHTPRWQVPDEPAHYNYIRALAEGRGFPVIEDGDYDQAYLGRLTSERFPPALSIEPLTYEDHQPPLYYLLATPLYWLFDGALVPLRLLSVALGVGVLVVAFGTVRTIFPTRPGRALMATAFIAFIPQHVAMTAGVNNDALAELVLGGTLWALAAYVGDGRKRPVGIGLLLAAALLTKTTAYVALPVAVLAVVLRWRHEQASWEWAARQLAWLLIPMVLLTAPWFIRNGLIYGWRDPLGLARHNAVVAGQPRTAQWLAQYGWSGLLGRLVRTTFHSFWGQFGWMAVPLSRRIYRGLGALSALLLLGFVVWLIRRRRSATRNRAALYLLAFSAVLTVGSFLWYNLTFVQHQGRYLFPALVPLATAAALGLDALTRSFPRWLRLPGLGALFAALAALDLYCLFEVVVPYLTR
jgi:4-amino-4-deoxy-L-arabinose transferase-like glycosyltransferase